jgi:hypothetical protein
MIDLAVAAVFARDLTEEQFRPQPRAPRRRSVTSRLAGPAGAPDAERRPVRRSGARLGRALGRLAHVRG